MAFIYKAVELAPDRGTPSSDSETTATPHSGNGATGPAPTAGPTAIPGQFTSHGPSTSSCTIIQADFDRTWRNFSDIDDAILLEERSFEAKQWSNVASEVVDLRDYKAALVIGIKTNLLKSFWRLAWVTWDTAKSGTGLGKSYAKVMDSAETGLQQFGNALSVTKGLTPSVPTYNAKTTTFVSRAKSLGLGAALSILTSDSPTALAQSLWGATLKETGDAGGVPSANISPQEIAILQQQQHLGNRSLDIVLQESYRVNAERRLRVEQLNAQIAAIDPELDRWEQAEKERVALSLEAGCNALRAG